ncbi:MAG TPA: hypothetical protein VNO70_13425 [Blastocatellia bacterium]|nr:hypothetical protein [Blastocatellia bacterium]
METIITRDTDILREYLTALDARDRRLSPFARLAASIKLARLRHELDDAQLEATEDDIATLKREVDERLERTFIRRFLAKPWGARLAVFLLILLGQQLILALIWLATLAFVRLSPTPSWWNPALPHEEPVFLHIFVFFFFFATPMLAFLALFGGRYYPEWRKTLPATLLIIALSVLGAYLVARNARLNPVKRSTSLSQMAKEQGVTVKSYRDWVDENWLLKDPKFQRDYENYLRNGPGRWITARFDAKNDAAWEDANREDGLRAAIAYLNEGQDPEGFREWLRYYLDRNRVYSEDRIEQEVNALTGEANQRFLGIWQVEPYLKERDERAYRAHLGSVNRGMKLWGLASLGLFTLIFLGIYLTGPALSFWEKVSGRTGRRARQGAVTSYDPEPRQETPGRISQLRERYESFPERREITTPPFFDTPFKLLSRVHRSFVRLVVFTSIFVFLFWAVVYLAGLSRRENPESQVDLMRLTLLPGAVVQADTTPTVVADTGAQENFNYATASLLKLNGLAGGSSREAALAARLLELEQRLEEADYERAKKFKEQEQLIASQRAEIDSLKSQTTQLETTTSTQLADLGARASAAETKASDLLGEVSAARQQAENVEKQVNTKLNEVENRVARVSDQVGKVEEQASDLDTEIKDLGEEFDRRTSQVEARTEELGERTEELKDLSLKEREERVARLQRAAFMAILSNLEAETDQLERRVQSIFYRLFNKGEAQRNAASLQKRIGLIADELRQMETEEAKELLGQFEELGKRVEQVAARVK